MGDKNIPRSRNALMVWVLALILLAVVALPAGAARWLGDAWGKLAQPARTAATVPLDSTNVVYVGKVNLEWAMPGEFSDPLPTPTPDPAAPPPPDLGEIDLGLELIRSGNIITGHVNLDFTLVFTREHQVGQVWYGPSIEGTFDGTDLTLTSERVSSVSAGQRLMRQFRLTGAAVPEQEGALRGEYRETIWGYGPQPLTVIGTFTLRELKEVAPDLGPSANFDAFPITGLAPLEVAFSDLSTGGPTSWHWDFGDGGISTEQNPTHVYSQPGNYDVTLTATNAIGSHTLTIPDLITVLEPAAPVAYFAASPRSGVAPLTVTFQDLSAGAPTSWAWDFGDGGASTNQHPQHTFSQAGSYTVKLTVGNAMGAHSLTAPNYITVTKAEQKIYLPLIFRAAP